MTNTAAIEKLNNRMREIYAKVEESKRSEVGRRGVNHVSRVDRACWMSEIRGLEYAVQVLKETATAQESPNAS